MDESLRFEGHIAQIAKNTFYRLKILYRIRDFLSVDLRIKLCLSLVLSKFDYADVVYGPRLLASTDRMVQRVQNACARYCFGVAPREHVTPYLNSARILKMSLRRELHLSSLLFGVFKTSKPEYLFNRFKFRGSRSSLYGIRSVCNDLLLPRCHFAVYKGSFKYSATKCWNNIPPPIKNLNTIGTFKLKLKQQLLEFQSTLPPGTRVKPSYL